MGMSADPTEDRGLPVYRDVVRREWIDYNGHMSEAFYVLVFGFTTNQVMDTLGMDESYRRCTGCSLYTVEAHIRYLDQARLDDRLDVTAQIVAGTDKKLHLAYEMRVAGTLVATEELLGIHVGDDRARPFGPQTAARIGRFTSVGPVQTPDWIGRAVRS